MITSAKPKKESCDDYMSEWREFLKKQFSDNVYFNLESWLKCIDAENKQATIYSRESDFIIRKMNLRVYEADYRVLFIWLPEKMHTACANKLLKIIEEPYPNTSIIMVSENPDQVLGTIMSRSQLIRIKPLETDLLTQTLKQKWGLDENAARQIAHLSAGNYLRATEQLSLETDSAYFLEQFKTIMRNGWSRNIVGMRSFAEEMSSHSRDKQKNFLDFCQRQIRENFIYSLDEPQMNYLNKKESDFAVNFSKFVNERNIVDMMEELELADRHISQNVNSKMVFFDLSMRIIVLIKK
jgi:DNA polymerase-3 subunit delta'